MDCRLNELSKAQGYDKKEFIKLIRQNCGNSSRGDSFGLNPSTKDHGSKQETLLCEGCTDFLCKISQTRVKNETPCWYITKKSNLKHGSTQVLTDVVIPCSVTLSFSTRPNVVGLVQQLPINVLGSEQPPLTQRIRKNSGTSSATLLANPTLNALKNSTLNAGGGRKITVANVRFNMW